MNILVIEDDIQMLRLYRDWLADILTSFSFKSPAIVSFVTNGNEADALLSASKHTYDITFLDLVLPGMSGIELYNKHLATLGDVVISSSYTARFREEAKVLDLYHGLSIMNKPFDKEDLRNQLSSLLRTKGVSEHADSSGTGKSQKYKVI